MSRIKDWETYRVLKAADPIAAERGRLLAARFVAESPEARERVESAYGVEFCRQMYPEAYKSGYARLIDRIRKAIPW